LAAGFVLFLWVKQAAVPASWNYDIWFREDSLTDLRNTPLSHGGNQSCEECHEDEYEDTMDFEHQTLSCESCHGVLVDHVAGDEKIANAVMDRSKGQCLSCHSVLISRPKDFPQFTEEVRRHRELKEGVPCVKCHGAHDPAAL
jgi:hypothetical protein